METTLVTLNIRLPLFVQLQYAVSELREQNEQKGKFCGDETMSLLLE